VKIVHKYPPWHTHYPSEYSNSLSESSADVRVKGGESDYDRQAYSPPLPHPHCPCVLRPACA